MKYPLIIIMVLIMTSVTYAEWWNPLTWFEPMSQEFYILDEITLQNKSWGQLLYERKKELSFNVTGAEQYLDIDYDVLNETSVEFVIIIDEPLEFKKNYKENELKNYPLYKYGEHNGLKLSDTNLNMDNGIQTIKFKIHYNKSFTPNGTFLKIGYNSISVYEDLGGPADYWMTTNLAVSSNGTLHIIYEDVNNKLLTRFTNNNGSTWSDPIYLINTTTNDHGIAMDSNDNLIIFFNNDTGSQEDYEECVSNDNSYKTFNCQKLVDSALNFKGAEIGIDSNDIRHYCINEFASDGVYYINSSAMVLDTVNDDNNDDTDKCNIAIGPNDEIYILGWGSDLDNLDIWSPQLNGWGNLNRVNVDNTATYQNRVHDLTVTDNGTLFIVGNELLGKSKIFRGYNNNNNYVWLQNLSSTYPLIASVGDNYIFVGGTNSGNLNVINSTDYGNTWSSPTTQASEADYSKFYEMLHPTSADASCTLWFSHVDSDLRDININNLTVPCVALDEDTDPPTFSGLTNNGSTIQNGWVNWSVIIADATNVDFMRFATNDSGTWTNYSLVDTTGTSVFYNYTEQISLGANNVSCGQFWANDTGGYSAVSDLSCFTVSASDTCTYGGSGDYTINCADDCTYSTSVNMNRNKIRASGTGTLRNLFKYFYNYTETKITGGCLAVN